MSINNLTIDGEFRYIIQWFNEWSELQRDDFVPILLNYITDGNTIDEDVLIATVSAPVNMNGLPNDLELNGRPMSLFQCRIKLFKQWNRNWPEEFKDKLQKKITEIDSKIGEKIRQALMTNGQCLTNGYESNENNSLTTGFNANDEKGVKAINNGVNVLAINDSVTEIVNNETSVDDIGANEDGIICDSNNSRCVEQHLLNNIGTITTNNADNNTNHNATGIVVVGVEIDNNDIDACNIIKHNNTINEREPVEQVVQLQNLQINEVKCEEKNNDDVAPVVEHKPQLASVTVTVNPIVVSQTITTNSEVPLVV